MYEVVATWTAIGILATGLFALIGLYFHLGASLGSRIDATNQRIDEVNARIDDLSDRVTARLDALLGVMQAHIERHAG
ncbi:MAG: hypothetical protein ACRDKZ_11835 [Actinomycetota bacterium]